MKKLVLILILLTVGFTTTLLAQGKNTSLPFIIVIDNEFVNLSDIINDHFLITDSIGTVKDSIMCDYTIGKLLMFKADYKRLFVFKRKPGLKIYFQFTWRRVLPVETDLTYKIQLIPLEINDDHMVIQIFNASNKENQQKYYFKQGRSYLYQILTPGYNRIMPLLKEE